jgi:hypothetical protein
VKFCVYAIIFLSVLSTTAFAGDAPPANSGTVLIVKVTNGTAQGRPITGDSVFVGIYQHEQLTDTIEGKVDASGQAVFENVPTGEHTVAVARARHNDMMFGSLPVALTTLSASYTASVIVYDVSDDNSKLSVGMHHFIVKAQADSIMITEYMQLKNSSDTAVISKEKDSQGMPIVLKMSLPEAFSNLRFSSYFEQAAVVTTPDGFYDTMAMPPGENHQAAFSYTLDINSATKDVVKRISLPTSEFVLFSQLGPGKIMGLGSANGRMTLSDGTEAEYFNLSAINAGDTINFQVTGFNVTRSQQKSWIIMGVVFGVAAVLAVLRLRPGSKQP